MLKNEKVEKKLNVELENCVLSIEKSKKGDFENLFLTTPNGVKFQIKMAFYNRKLDYKIKCEIRGN